MNMSKNIDENETQVTLVKSSLKATNGVTPSLRTAYGYELQDTYVIVFRAKGKATMCVPYESRSGYKLTTQRCILTKKKHISSTIPVINCGSGNTAQAESKYVYKWIMEQSSDIEVLLCKWDFKDKKTDSISMDWNGLGLGYRFTEMESGEYRHWVPKDRSEYLEVVEVLHTFKPKKREKLQKGFRKVFTLNDGNGGTKTGRYEYKYSDVEDYEIGESNKLEELIV